MTTEKSRKNTHDLLMKGIKWAGDLGWIRRGGDILSISPSSLPLITDSSMFYSW
jgi:hypothetical protein